METIEIKMKFHELIDRIDDVDDLSEAQMDSRPEPRLPSLCSVFLLKQLTDGRDLYIILLWRQ